MALHTYGDSALPVTNNNKIVYTTTTGNGTSNNTLSGTVTVTQTCAFSDYATVAPALNSAYAGDAHFLATNVQITQTKAELCEIVTTYTASATSLPTTSYAEQSSQIEVAIQEHPSFADWADDWDEENQRFIASSTKAGITSYIKGTTTVTVTTYYDSKPTSDRANIGKIQNPGSDYSGTSNWLLVGCNRSLQGVTWVMQKTYLYSAKAWNSDIYT